MTNTTVAFEGKTYKLIDEAYLCGTQDAPRYESHAICEADKADEDGWQPSYIVKWDYRDGYDPETMEEDMACDWDEPYAVEADAEYNVSKQQCFC